MELRTWYLYSESGQAGPYTLDEVKSWLAKGSISLDWLAWKDGFADWTRLGDLAEFTAPAPPTPPAAPAAPRMKPAHHQTQSSHASASIRRQAAPKPSTFTRPSLLTLIARFAWLGAFIYFALAVTFLRDAGIVKFVCLGLAIFSGISAYGLFKLRRWAILLHVATDIAGLAGLYSIGMLDIFSIALTIIFNGLLFACWQYMPSREDFKNGAVITADSNLFLSLGFFAVAGVTVIGMFGFRWVYTSIFDLTGSQPAAMETNEFSAERCEEIAARWEEHKQTLEQSATKVFKITSDDFNGFISCDMALEKSAATAIDPSQKESLKALTQHIRLDLKGKHLVLQTNFSLDPLVGFTGRYMNSVSEFELTVISGIPIMNLKKLEFGGKRLPADFEKGLFAENLAKDFLNNPETAEVFKKIQWLEIKKGEMIINQPPPPPPPTRRRQRFY